MMKLIIKYYTLIELIYLRINFLDEFHYFSLIFMNALLTLKILQLELKYSSVSVWFPQDFPPTQCIKCKISVPSCKTVKPLPRYEVSSEPKVLSFISQSLSFCSVLTSFSIHNSILFPQQPASNPQSSPPPQPTTLFVQ